MSYKSLNPSNHEFSGESDESIQGSPLLDTVPRFGEVMVESPSSCYEPPNAFDRRDSNYGHINEHPSSLRNVGGERAKVSSIQSNSWRSHNQVFERPVVQPLRESQKQTRTRTKHAAINFEDERAPMDSPDKLNPLGVTLERSTNQRGDNGSMPSRLSLRHQHSESESHVLTFNSSPQPPNSMLIKKSFEPEKNTETVLLEEDEDDVLPFSTTKQMAWSGRPQSTVRLAQNSGQIMTKETFDNYRKSISSVGMLKRMSSTGSFRSEKNVSRRKNADGGSVDDVDVKSLESLEESEYLEKEEHAHEQDKKRASAKLRQQQDARMSVYRQRMKRIVGGSSDPALAPDHSMRFAGAESSFVDLGDEDSGSEDLMDDIPLSILQAHGFPKSRRKSSSSVSTQRLSSSVVLGSPKLRTQSTSLGPVPTFRISMLSQSSVPIESGSLAPTSHNLRGSSYPELPAVFGNKSSIGTRGLINVIAEEEELRKRRHTFGYGSAMPQTSSRVRSLAGAPRGSGQPQPHRSDDMQTKLDQVLSLLSTMSPSSTTQANLGSSSPGFQPGNPWSIPSQMNQRAPSIHSAYSAQTTHYRDTYRGHRFAIPGEYVQDFPPQLYMEGTSSIHPMHPSHSSSFVRHMPSLPAMSSQPNLFRGSQAFTRSASNRPSRIRVVKNSNAEEEDDEAEWQKLMEQRKLLREQWKTTEEVSSV